MKLNARQVGFTLIEVLVIIAILAVLAGVLLPSLLNNTAKADAQRVVSDLNSIRLGIETFATDVKRFPGDIDDLMRKPTGGAALPLADTALASSGVIAYPTALAARWKGPYVDLQGHAANGDSVYTGFEARIIDNFSTSTGGNAATYVTLTINGLGSADVTAVDESIDASDGAAAGRFQWNTTTFVATYKAVMIN